MGRERVRLRVVFYEVDPNRLLFEKETRIRLNPVFEFDAGKEGRGSSGKEGG